MTLFLAATLRRADRFFAAGREAEGFRALRRLSIDQIGRLLNDGAQEYPALRAALPEMPSAQVERDWTGNSGGALLAQTCDFVRSMERAYRRHCGQGLADATILDYGCGWGRVMRLMYRFSDPSRIYGVDPWPASLAACRVSRVRGHLELCAEVPQELAFPGVAFDLVYAYSVFTHLSEKTAAAVLAAIRPRLRAAGLLVLTVRPVEYWWAHTDFPPGTDRDTAIRRHHDEGYAFVPHHREPIGGDVTYGDASVSLDYARQHWSGWRLVGTEASRSDPGQVLLFLQVS